MITPDELRERLSEKPFRPFRVALSDGSSHDVPHPEFAWVFGNSIFVGKSGKLPFGLGDYARQLSILHITRIDPLGAKRPATRKKK